MEEVLRANVENIGIGNDAERALVDAAIGRDTGAFAALCDRHLDRVYRYAYYMVGNRADAEDVTQQVFLNAWGAIGRYRHTGASFISWLLKIAHNEAISVYRRAKDSSPIDLEVVSQGRWSDPEAETILKYDRLAVRRAILRLKPEQQQVIIMRFIEHFDYVDIAAAIGKSEGNVRVIQCRALGELRRSLTHEVKV